MSGTVTTASLTLKELAGRRGITPAETKRLLAPFFEAGIILLHEDGRLELVDRVVAFAIAGEEVPEA